MKVMEIRGARRERRDWLLIVLILPLGTLLMFLAGQQAVQTVSTWSVQADMVSHLDPGHVSTNGGAGLIEPLRAEIGTPAAWLSTFLTPQPNQPGQSGGGLPPLVVFDPSATPSPTVSPTVTATPTTTTPTTTTTVTGTPPTATRTRTPTRTRTNTPTASPTTSTPTASPTTPSPTPTASPTTIDPSLTPITPPPGATVGPPDGNIPTIPDGSYFLLDINSNPIIVDGTGETNYDMVFYESDTGTNIQMDQIIIGITNDTLWLTYQYYEVFNWGDGAPDANSNVDTTALSPPISST